MRTASNLEIKIGMCAEARRQISDSDVRRFSEATGDFNPIHLDDALAADSIFGRRVAHGMLSASLISALLARDLPGPGTIYLSQTLSFRRPVGIGDTLRASVHVLELDEEKRVCVLSTLVHNQEEELVLEGEAKVRVP